MKKLLLALITLFVAALNVFAQNKPYRAYLSTPVVISSGNGSGSVFNSKLYFQAFDSSTSAYTCWEFTGSGNPAKATANIDKNNIVDNGTIYYGYDDGTHGTEIYKWDGTNPPAMTQDLNPATTGSKGVDMQIPVSLNNIIYFGGFDNTYGRELWKYDPATNTGMRLTDINAGTNGSLVSNDEKLIVFNNKIYFSSVPSFNLGGKGELHCYDPSNGSTTMVADICPGSAGSDPENMIIMGSKLYFAADDGTHGREIYYYDGTNPVQMALDLCPNTGSDKDGVSRLYPGVIAFNNKFYFWGKNNPSSTHYDLWSFDPANNTAALAYAVRAPGRIGTVYHNKLYFTENTSTSGNVKSFLLSYDGINPPKYVDTSISLYYISLTYYQNVMTIFNDDLYFPANTNAIPVNAPYNLYRFNDTATSIQAINQIADVSLYPNPSTNKTTIGFSLREQQNLSLAITDINGRIVYSENKKQYQSGNSKIVVDMHSFATGNYTCRLTDEHNALVWSGKVVKE
jgi:ELWxxDGT repeat protein